MAEGLDVGRADQPTLLVGQYAARYKIAELRRQGLFQVERAQRLVHRRAAVRALRLLIQHEVGQALRRFLDAQRAALGFDRLLLVLARQAVLDQRRHADLERPAL